MANRMDVELIQDKYTNFIAYDGSERNNSLITWVPLIDVTGITVVFKSTSQHLTDDMVYVFDSTQTAQHTGNKQFLGYNFSLYDKEEVVNLIVDGTEFNITVDQDIVDAPALAAFLNASLDVSNTIALNTLATVTAGANYLKITTISATSNSYIKILGGTLATRIGWRIGIYRGNDILWNNVGLIQEDLKYTIYPEDLGFTGVIPDGRWDIEMTTLHTLPDSPYYNTYVEYSSMNVELYRAKMFEYIALNNKLYADADLRYYTKDEQWLYKMIYFDSVFRSFRAALEVGNDSTALDTLTYLTNFINVNVIS